MTQELGEVFVRGLPLRVCEVARRHTQSLAQHGVASHDRGATPHGSTGVLDSGKRRSQRRMRAKEPRARTSSK